jgi:UDP-2,3-diacylglucosamine pyrophosphatase LpxH
VRALLLRARFDRFHSWLKLADSGQVHSVYMGDVNYQNKIENNRGVVMGHAHSTATDGVRITGSSTSV